MGDANTKFFHYCLKSRLLNNFIVSINTLEGIVELVEGITEGVYNYFKKMFKKPDCSRPTLEGIDFKSLSPAQSRLFEEPFSKVEIKAAAWDCDGKKSTGPDAFNLEFIKRCWYILKSDVLGFFQEFHSNDVLPKSFISYFLTLIPNNKNHVSLNEYKPLCLVGSLYKVLSKLLATRLK